MWWSNKVVWYHHLNPRKILLSMKNANIYKLYYIYNQLHYISGRARSQSVVARAEAEYY